MTDISKDLLAIRPVHAGVKEVEEKMQFAGRKRHIEEKNRSWRCLKVLSDGFVHNDK